MDAGEAARAGPAGWRVCARIHRDGSVSFFDGPAADEVRPQDPDPRRRRRRRRPPPRGGGHDRHARLGLAGKHAQGSEEIKADGIAADSSSRPPPRAARLSKTSAWWDALAEESDRPLAPQNKSAGAERSSTTWVSLTASTMASSRGSLQDYLSASLRQSREKHERILARSDEILSRSRLRDSAHAKAGAIEASLGVPQVASAKDTAAPGTIFDREADVDQRAKRAQAKNIAVGDLLGRRAVAGLGPEVAFDSSTEAISSVSGGPLEIVLDEEANTTLHLESLYDSEGGELRDAAESAVSISISVSPASSACASPDSLNRSGLRECVQRDAWEATGTNNDEEEEEAVSPFAGKRVGTRFDTVRARGKTIAAALADAKAALASEDSTRAAAKAGEMRDVYIHNYEHLLAELEAHQLEMLHELNATEEHMVRHGVELGARWVAVRRTTLRHIRGHQKSAGRALQDAREAYYAALVLRERAGSKAAASRAYAEHMMEREVVMSVQNDCLRDLVRACKLQVDKRTQTLAGEYVKSAAISRKRKDGRS